MNRSPWTRHKSLFTTPTPRAVREPKARWRLLPILWMALKRTCMLLGAVVLISTFLLMWSLSSVVDQIDDTLPDKMVLHLDLNGDLGDLPKDQGMLSPFAEPTRTVKNFTDALDRAARDPRVAGVYARFEGGTYSMAHLEEMRHAIKDFRKSGKFSYIYAMAYSSGLGGYYLASAFDEIWMQPMGLIMIPGLSAEMPFFRSVLDTVGIEPQFFKRKDYKNAYASMTNHDITPPHRENMEELLGDIYGVFSVDIAEDRGISVELFNRYVNRGLLMSDEALKAGLIDRLDYSDVLGDYIKDKVSSGGDNLHFEYVSFDSYVAEMLNDGSDSLFGKAESTKPRVALVYAVGAIMDNDGTKSSLASVVFDNGIAAADDISSTLMDIADNDDIAAVVLRVDSPGGSPVASETILRAVQKIQESGKVVIVSMGPTAASGGYWIAALADRIFVLPTTITGSIGVLGGKFSGQKLWETLGVNWVRVGMGDNAGMWSFNTPFSEKEAERMNAMLDNVYVNFIKRVAQGRDMSEEEVDRIAGGRVWSGLRAIKIGLADELGGLNEALDYAAVQAGAEDRYGVDVVIMPKPLSSIERLIKVIEGQVSVGEFFGAHISSLIGVKLSGTEFLGVTAQSPVTVYNSIDVQ